MENIAKTVQELFMSSLFPERPEDTSKAVLVDGIVTKFGFDPQRLEVNRAKVIEILDEMPANFHEHTGGGWSFLNLCIDKNGVQWGGHQSMEQLVTMAIGLGLAEYQLPREMWSVLPGGMPYVVFKTNKPVLSTL